MKTPTSTPTAAESADGTRPCACTIDGSASSARATNDDAQSLFTTLLLNTFAGSCRGKSGAGDRFEALPWRACMKIATWNVNGIRARQSQLQEWMDAERPDVLCLQEIKASIDQLPVWLCEFEGYWCYWHGSGGYSGVALHVSKGFSPARP